MYEHDPQTRMYSESIRICQSCNRDNLPDALVCVHCGAAIGSTTIIVPDKPIGVTRANNLSQIIRLHDDALVLLVATQDQPIVLKGDGKFLLGRRVENEMSPTLDLGRYGGHLRGVSRRHATIQRTAEGYVIEDLNSANGSFVNEKRLHPAEPHLLRNGDLIRLGQLIVFAYFTTFRQKTTELATERIIWLTESEGQNTTLKLTLQQLMSQLLPYLNAIVTLQSILDDLKGNPSTEMEISQIAVEKQSNRIRVGLICYPDALQLIQEKLNPMRSEFAGSLKSELLEMSQPIETIEPENVSTTLRVQGPSDSYLQMFSSQRGLAEAILTQVAPSLAAEAKDAYIQRLLLPLYALTTSRFELTSESAHS